MPPLQPIPPDRFYATTRAEHNSKATQTTGIGAEDIPSWVNSDGQRDLCEYCIHRKAKATPRACQGSSAWRCRSCKKPACSSPTAVLSCNTFLVACRQEIFHDMLKCTESLGKVRIALPLFPLVLLEPYITSLEKALIRVARRDSTQPWDRWPQQSSLWKDQRSSCGKRTVSHMFTVQEFLDRFLCFSSVNHPDSVAAYGSLIMKSTGDMVLATVPAILEYQDIPVKGGGSLQRLALICSTITIPNQLGADPVVSEVHPRDVSFSGAASTRWPFLPPYDNYDNYVVH